MTTLFIPMTAAQAEWAFLNRAEAFARALDTSADGSLVGFQKREDAIAAEGGKHVRRFALVRVSFDHSTHEMLAFAGALNGVGVDQATGAPVWTIKGDGIPTLADPARAEMTMEFIPCQLALSEQQRVDVFSLPTEPVGPTGHGC